MEKKSYKIYTLGCKVNQYDSARLSADFLAAGWRLVDSGADLAILNSCAVTKTAIRKARQLLNIVKNENPSARIVLSGCWPKIYGKETENFGVDWIWAGSKADLFLWVKNKFGQGGFEKDGLTMASSELVDSDRTRYFLKIQDGCEQFCSYCIIPYARGKSQSRKSEEIISEVLEASNRGFSEIILSGIHLGLFGRDQGTDLFSLLKDLTVLDQSIRFRLSSIEIGEVTDGIIRLMEKSGKICRHLHIPLQSGSDKILRLMNRPYDALSYSRRIEEIRRAIPDISLTTDVIVGFPGETEKDFLATVEFARRCIFSKIHVFPFSAHEKTPAFSLPDQVFPKEKKARAAALRKISCELEEEYKRKYRQGKSDWICVSRIENNTIQGLSEYYLPAKGQVSEVIEGDLRVRGLVKLKIGKV